MDLHTIIISMIIGIIEGITEFLPISSTGHMIIISHWLKIENNNIKILEIFIQLGSALAILYFFHKKIINLINFKNNICNKKSKNIHILISIFPTILIGLTFYKNIKLLFNINNVIYSLLLGSFFLLISETLKPNKYKICRIHDITLFECMMIGLFQIFSLCPGFSRSGVTIGTGILMGMKRSVAIDFSFIISIPLLLGSSLFDFINNFNTINLLDLPIFFIGCIVSFVVSLLFIKKLLTIINNTSLIFFAIYRFIIAGLVYFIN